MNILFGNKEIESIREESRFTVLELDIIQPSPDHDPQPAYCVLSDVPLAEISELTQKVRMHHDMVHFYRSGQWDECRSLIAQLRGSWQGEVDSFYDEITRRLDSTGGCAANDWDGIYRPWRN